MSFRCWSWCLDHVVGRLAVVGVVARSAELLARHRLHRFLLSSGRRSAEYMGVVSSHFKSDTLILWPEQARTRLARRARDRRRPAPCSSSAGYAGHDRRGDQRASPTCLPRPSTGSSPRKLGILKALLDSRSPVTTHPVAVPRGPSRAAVRRAAIRSRSSPGAPGVIDRDQRAHQRRAPACSSVRRSRIPPPPSSSAEIRDQRGRWQRSDRAQRSRPPVSARQPGLSPASAEDRVARAHVAEVYRAPRRRSWLVTSAPRSAISADAAGTKVCSATSRMRTPRITAVMTFPLSWSAGRGSGWR